MWRRRSRSSMAPTPQKAAPSLSEMYPLRLRATIFGALCVLHLLVDFPRCCVLHCSCADGVCIHHSRTRLLEFGAIDFVKIVVNPDTQQPRGTAFAKFKTNSDAEAAIAAASKVLVVEQFICVCIYLSRLTSKVMLVDVW